MEKEIMPDGASEMIYRKFVTPKILTSFKDQKKEMNQCVVFCKKMTPHVFAIKKGVAMVDGAKDLFNDGICMIAPATKVVFVFE